MIRLILIVACFVLTCGSGCGSSSWRHVDVEPLIDGGGVVTSEFRHGSPYVYVSINGNDPELFLFDTGANINSITPEGARRLGLRIVSTLDSLDGNENRKSSPYGIADRVEFGPVIQSGVGFLVTEPSRLADKDRIGIIGINGLQGFMIDLDFPQERLSITNERLDARSPHVTRYISREFAKVYAPVEISQQNRRSTVWTLLDTGNSGSLRLNKHKSDKFTRIDQARVVDIAVGSHDIPWEVSAAPLVGSLILGDTVIEGLHATVNQADNNIGIDLFEDFHVKIDGPSKLVSFERPDHARRVVWVEHLGLYPLYHDSIEWHPGFVIPGGLADSLGITYQDVLLLIDGREPNSHLHWAEFWPISDDATSVTLRLLRKGEEIEVVLPLDLAGE